MFNWWNALPRWAQDILARIPSSVQEFVSGFIAVACGYGIMWSLAHLGSTLPTNTTGAFIITAFAAHFCSLVYEIFLDPRRNDPTHPEVKDLLQREVGIVSALVIAHSVLF